MWQYVTKCNVNRTNSVTFDTIAVIFISNYNFQKNIVVKYNP